MSGDPGWYSADTWEDNSTRCEECDEWLFYDWYYCPMCGKEVD